MNINDSDNEQEENEPSTVQETEVENYSDRMDVIGTKSEIEGETDTSEAKPANSESMPEGAKAEQESDAPSDPPPLVDPEAVIADLKDQLLRALAETENIRRRASREKEDTARYSIANFARDMLSVSDNMNRALEAVPEDARAGDSVMGSLWKGIEMTERELISAMERHGIKKIEPLGQKFDHNLHQAMFEVPDQHSEPNTVVQVIQIGYIIGERLLRPAMVGVAKAAEDENSSENDPPDVESDAT